VHGWGTRKRRYARDGKRGVRVSARSEKRPWGGGRTVVRMITNVSLATVWVADQDSAKAFYVEKLGFVT
jgi:hypothetical protein